MPAPRGRNGADPSLVSRLNASIQMHPANNLVRLDKYYRSADLLERQAKQYRRQANEEQLYVMLMRLVSLVVETIPQHRAYNREDPTYQYWRKVSLFELMPELERLKVSLDLKDRTARLLEEEPWTPIKQPGTVRLAAGDVPEVHWPTTRPTGDATAAATTIPMLSDLNGASSAPRDPFELGAGASVVAPPAPLLLPDLSSRLALPAASASTLSRHAILPVTGHGIPGQAEQTTRLSPPGAEAAARSSATSLYPSVTVEPARPEPVPLADPWNDAGLGLGPQEVGVGFVAPPTAPPLPGETCCDGPVPTTQVVPVAAPAPLHKPEPAKRQQVRDVHVSVGLMDEFLRYATSNTRRGIETCGILAGTLSVDDAVFTITTLIVPKQEGTTDTVQALGEEEIFEVQDKRGLYPLGWIHTHPTQTCFLSSVDVHTQCGYQTMLDEAVAIVMAPQDPTKRVGIFRLSAPGGLRLVQRCELRGFHTHPPTDTGQPLYQYCKHVYLNPRIGFDVVDLR